ncbi:hypothetical protein Tsubulata_028319 [Turnera subulata]|uniref:TF-B3 domain-containing protein n=1 Tax=Turnera subulata TaxID=218843 RepID=A0A9Q0FMJ6_9ROSI|nr:hypothetical protein Tsubulata_028319 [Turnera subulata]
MSYLTTSSNPPPLPTEQPPFYPAQYLHHMQVQQPTSENDLLLPFPYPHSLELLPELGGAQYLPPAAVLDPMYPYCLDDQTGLGMQSLSLSQQPPTGWSAEQERRALDAYRTKLARCNRKLARQRSLSKQASSSSSSATAAAASSGANRNQVVARRRPAAAPNPQPRQQLADNGDPFRFFPSVNKRLRFVVKKILRNSDVGSLGRIVLPKRDSEENLPVLWDKEGIQLMIRDLNTNQSWDLKFKFWANNKSRMYVLENTGDLAKHNGLKLGDSLTLYEDDSRNLWSELERTGTCVPRSAKIAAAQESFEASYTYFSIQKRDKGVAVESFHEQQNSANQSQSYPNMPQMCQVKEEEEDAYLALLLEQFNHKQQEVNSLTTFYAEGSCSYAQSEEMINVGPFDNFAGSSSSSSSYFQAAPEAVQPFGQVGLMDDHLFDDFYTGLGMLPDVYSCSFLL